MVIMQIISVLWLIFGLFFYFVGVLGVVRLPDAYSRLHASGKVVTMGLLGIILAVGFVFPSESLKLIVLGFFVSIAAPVTSHAIAKADKEYSERQKIARDTSISEAGAQEQIRSTTEIQIDPVISD